MCALVSDSIVTPFSLSLSLTLSISLSLSYDCLSVLYLMVDSGGKPIPLGSSFSHLLRVGAETVSRLNNQIC